MNLCTIGAAVVVTQRWRVGVIVLGLEVGAGRRRGLRAAAPRRGPGGGRGRVAAALSTVSACGRPAPAWPGFQMVMSRWPSLSSTADAPATSAA